MTKRHKRGTAFVAIAIAVTMGATACGSSGGSSSNSGSGSSNSGSAKKGGTLTIYNQSDYDHLDPQRAYTTEAISMDQILARTLTLLVPQANGTSKLVGDIATGTGTPSNGNKTWTFHIRNDVKFQDGTTVTSKDIKYGMERAFSGDISGGPTYMQQWLVGGSKYKGPFKGQSLPSIETPNATTIVFKLNTPVPDFNYAVSMPFSSPVEKSKDTGTSYDTHVQSTGPYEIKSYARGKELILVKNPHWSASTDPNREQNFNEIDVKQGQNEAAIDQNMKSQSGNTTNAITQFPIDGANLASFSTNPQTKPLVHNIPAPFVNYIAMNTEKIKNVKVRKAIGMAVNKVTFRGAFGGSAYGDIASSFLNPQIKGRLDYNPYTSNQQGDPAGAKKLLKEAGVSHLTLTMAIENIPTEQKAGEAIVAALKQVGITVKLSPQNRSSYFSIIGNSKQASKQFDLIWADWGADWPNASTVLPVLFDHRNLIPQGNNVLSMLNDPKISQKIDAIKSNPDPAKSVGEWGQLDKYIMTTDAPAIPMIYMKNSSLVGKNIKVVDDTSLGQTSLLKIGLK